MALANAAQPAPQPRIAQRRIDRDRLVKKQERLPDPVLRGQKKALQRNRRGVARRQSKRLLQRGQRLWRAPETEFEFGNPRPGEAEVRGFLRGRFGGEQGRFKLGTGLQDIRFGHPLGCQDRR